MDSKQRKLLLTFDYELFLGKNSGDVNDTIIIPTNRILGTLSKLKSRAIFFIDATYIVRLIEHAELHEKSKEDLERIERQIGDILSRGHEIGLHIHSHWLDAKYIDKGGYWDLSDSTRFAVASLSGEELKNVFSSSYRALMGLIQKYDSGYRISSFRAGGLCIQPFVLFRPYFDKYAIRNEFSVLRGSELIMKTYGFNFKGVTDDEIYRFSNDVGVKDENGKYIQYSINKIQLSFMAKLLNSIYFRFFSIFIKPKSRGKGTSPAIDKGENGMKSPGGYLSKKATETLSIENLNITKFFSYLRYMRRSSYIHFISHPKLLRRGQLFLFYMLVLSSRFSRGNYRYDFECWIDR
jgi:hypothetical protein